MDTKEIKLIDRNFDDRSRISVWLKEDGIEWLENKKNHIEAISGCECEIRSREKDDGFKEYCLAFKNGYYHLDRKSGDIKWVNLYKSNTEGEICLSKM